MKKIFFLFVIVFSLLSSFSYADGLSNTPKDKRWYWILSNSEQSFYVDTKTLKYEDVSDTATCFVMVITPSEGTFFIRKYTISYKTNYITEGKGEKYAKGNPTPIKYLASVGKVEIMPETFGEKLAETVADLTSRNKKQAYKKDIQDNPGHIAY